jgi:hypothetical protein
VGGVTEPAGEYTFFYEKGNYNHELVTVFLIGCLSLLVIGFHT